MNICSMQCKLPGTQIKTGDWGTEDKGTLQALWTLIFSVEQGEPKRGRTCLDSSGAGVRIFLSQKEKQGLRMFLFS